jgi:hypothetical protein
VAGRAIGKDAFLRQSREAIRAELGRFPVRDEYKDIRDLLVDYLISAHPSPELVGVLRQGLVLCLDELDLPNDFRFVSSNTNYAGKIRILLETIRSIENVLGEHVAKNSSIAVRRNVIDNLGEVTLKPFLKSVYYRLRLLTASDTKPVITKPIGVFIDTSCFLAMAGNLWNNCAVRVAWPQESRPNMAFIPFVRQDLHALHLSEPAFVGGVAIIGVWSKRHGEGKNQRSERRSLIIRGFNPRGWVWENFAAEDFLESVMEYIEDFAKANDFDRILVNNDRSAGTVSHDLQILEAIDGMKDLGSAFIVDPHTSKEAPEAGVFNNLPAKDSINYNRYRILWESDSAMQ